MPNFYKGNSVSSIGEPARLLLCPSTYVHPTKISDVVNLSTYAITAGTPWIELGLTKTATNMQVMSDVNQWENQQFGRYRVVPTHSQAEVTTDALEWTQANRVHLMQAFASTDSAASESKTNFPALTKFVPYHIAVLHLDQNGLVHMSYFPNCRWNGAAIAQMIGRGEQASIPFSFTSYPDDTLLDDSAGGVGQALFRQDFDQYSTIP